MPQLSEIKNNFTQFVSNIFESCISNLKSPNHIFECALEHYAFAEHYGNLSEEDAISIFNEKFHLHDMMVFWLNVGYDNLHSDKKNDNYWELFQKKIDDFELEE